MARPLLETLESHLRRPVDEPDRVRAARHLLDWTGCAVAGASTEAGLAFRRAGEPGDIAVLGQDAGMTPRSAAVTMGALGNPLEMDDVDRTAILHPGPVVIPAALVAAQMANASAPALLDAIIRGYDAMIRLGRTVGPGHYAKFHNTSTCGPLGAAVAASDLLGLNGEQTIWAMGNAVTQAAGFWACRHEDVMAKQVHTAHAAEAGLSAALLAQAGVSGPRRILEGPQGFYEGMCPDADPKPLFNDQDTWCLHQVSFKPWPACRHCHPAIDAALVLRDRIGDPAHVTHARIAVYRDAALMCDTPSPDTSLSAKFSLQHAVALTLADGPPDLSGFEDEARARSDLSRLRSLSKVTVDDALSAAYPAHFGTTLTLDLADGTTLTEHRTDAAGDPELPMNDDALIAKAKTLMDWGGLAPDRADRLIGAALDLPNTSNLDELLDALRGTAPLDNRQIA